MFRTMSLLTRFGVASAVLLAVVGIVLAETLSALIEKRAWVQAEHTAVVAVGLGIAPRLDSSEFASPIEGPDKKSLDRAMAEAALTQNGYQVLRVKVFNSSGTVIYSDLEQIVGKTYGSADLERALDGDLVSKTTTLDDQDELLDNASIGSKALEVYVPLTYGAGEPVGVAEIYLPYAPVADAIAQDVRLLYATLVAALLAFYLLMFRIVARASRRLLDQAHELGASAERNEYLAHHDVLTALPNRTLLSDRLERAVLEARRRGTDVGVLLIDLDRFKEVNDTLGHQTGDALLRQVGDRIADELREMDTVARLGGDEFVVLLPQLESIDAAIRVTQRILDGLHRPFTVQGIDLAVEASIGIACYPDHGGDHGVLLQHADVAMYVAKEARGTYAVYDAGSDTSSLSRTTLLNELRRALDERELVLYYQPTAELSDGAVRSVEALVRWQHPTRGLLTPMEFVPVAEQTGLISDLTTYVISEALRQLRVWLDEGRDLCVSVNLSARNLMDPNLPVLVESLLAQAGVDASRLEVEVTETSAMADPILAAAVLSGLSELGVSVAVDDYGTGYSSLSYLRSLPIGTLKIDRSFVTRMRQDEGNAVIVRSTIELAHNLGLRVVAEGVEDLETYDVLAGLGCTVAQGYFLSRPVPPGTLAVLLDLRAARLSELVPSTSIPPDGLAVASRA
jgi:diguanylate cyclase (GGDEF)-like protein